jgi:hypothetical protein
MLADLTAAASVEARILDVGEEVKPHHACSCSLQSRQWRVQGTASKRALEIGFLQTSQTPNVPCLILSSAPSIALNNRTSV